MMLDASTISPVNQGAAVEGAGGGGGGRRSQFRKPKQQELGTHAATTVVCSPFSRKLMRQNEGQIYRVVAPLS